MIRNDSRLIQFENAIRNALAQFKQRLEQQRSFQIQNMLLKQLNEAVKWIKYCGYKEVESLSLEYEKFYKELSESGRTYENIADEKSLVDVYSAFEKFLFDCFCCLYTYFPKYLGTEVKVRISDLFVDENIELCKRNIIELNVKSFIQSSNIMDVIKGFDKKFSIKIIFSEEEENDMDRLYEISLIRNLIIHSNSIVNRIYKEQINKFLGDEKVRYPFAVGDTVLSRLPDIVDEIKELSSRVCEKIADTITNDSKRLENHHATMP